MKAMRLAQFGSPHNLRLEDSPDPAPRAGEVLVKVEAAGINPADLVRMSGNYPLRLPLPYIPGTDVAGTVVSVGRGAGDFGAGDKVFGRSTNGGGYAERAVLPANETFLLPPSLTFAEGAAIPVPFYTAQVAIHEKARLTKGETVLVSAGGGGVGVAAIQLAKVVGATVITTVGSAEKAEQAQRIGADHTIHYKEVDFVAEVQKITDGKGVDVILESVAADNFADDFRAISRRGRIVIIGTGTAKSTETRFVTGMALFKEVAIYGMALPNSAFQIPDVARTLIGLFEAGRVHAVVHRSYPLVAAANALQDLIAGKVFGKLVLLPHE